MNEAAEKLDAAYRQARRVGSDQAGRTNRHTK